MRNVKLNLEKFIYLIFPKIVIVFIVIFLFYVCFSAVHEKKTVKLDALFDAQNNVIIFSPELEDDDYIWEVLLGISQNGEYISEYNVNIRCYHQVEGNFKEECLKASIEQQPTRKEKVILVGENAILIPKPLLEKGTFSIAIRTSKYEKMSSSMWFCVKNGELIVENSITETNQKFTKNCLPVTNKPSSNNHQ